MKKYIPEQFGSIHQMLQSAAEKSGEKTAYRYFSANGEITDVSFSEFYSDTQELICGLAQLGLLNAHIACVGKNSYKWITVFLAVLQGNGVFVPVDKELPFENIENVLISSDCEAVFYDAEYKELFENAADSLSNIKYFICFDDVCDNGKYRAYRKIAALGANTPCLPPQISLPDDVKMLVYTSGTTGSAKGVMLTEKNLLAVIKGALEICEPLETTLSVLPYYHTYEAVCDILLAIYYPVTVCINDSLKNVTKNMKLFQPEYIFVVPMFAEIFYSNIKRVIKKTGCEKKFEAAVKMSNELRKCGIDVRRRAFSRILDEFGGKLQYMVCGGAPIRPEIGSFFDDIGVTLLGGYGITECAPLVSVNSQSDFSFSDAGFVLSCLEVKIDSPDENGIGEITVRGDSVMKGYYKATEKTAEAIVNGWLHTGDYGRLVPGGRIAVTGRKKNLIVLSNGKNVYPEEIEGYIQKIGYIAEVVVHGIKNEYGEEIGIEAEVFPVIPRSSEEIEKDILQILSPLPQYKHINRVVVRSEPFAKTSTQKIIRV